MKKRPIDDVHDGHGDYKAEAERDLKGVVRRRFGDVVFALMGSWAVAYWVYLATWPESPRGFDTLFGGIGLAILGLFGTAFLTKLLSDVTLAPRSRGVIVTIITLLFALGVALPMWVRGRAEGASRARHNQVESDFQQTRDRADKKWIDDLYAAGAHGPLGTEPPMLVVEDDGTAVEVRNITEQAINCVHIVRHLPGGGGGIILRIGGEDCLRLGPGDSATYEASEIQSTYEHGPLEFRIGDPSDPEPTWWSDNALDSNYIREMAH